jgi:hypothetical protein
MDRNPSPRTRLILLNKHHRPYRSKAIAQAPFRTYAPQCRSVVVGEATEEQIEVDPPPALPVESASAGRIQPLLNVYEENL